MPQPSGCCRGLINNRYWYFAIYWRRPLEKSMDWLLKGGLYIVHIINSMNMPTYVGILLIMFVLSIYSIVKYRKIKEPWKVLIYLASPEFIVFITNRIIKEYWSNTHLYNISSTVALITGGIVMSFYICCRNYYKDEGKALKRYYSPTLITCRRILGVC